MQHAVPTVAGWTYAPLIHPEFLIDAGRHLSVAHAARNSEKKTFKN